ARAQPIHQRWSGEPLLELLKRARKDELLEALLVFVELAPAFLAERAAVEVGLGLALTVAGEGAHQQEVDGFRAEMSTCVHAAPPRAMNFRERLVNSASRLMTVRREMPRV